MKHLLFIVCILLVPLVCFSQLPVAHQTDSIEAFINSDSFKIQFSFDPRQVDVEKGEYVYHVVRYDIREGNVYRTYYRQPYMDGELTFVSEKQVDQHELQELKEFVKGKYSPSALAAWCIRSIAIMHIQKDNKTFSLGIIDGDKPWLTAYLKKLK